MNNKVELQKSFESKLQEALCSTMFPKESVEDLFIVNIYKALTKNSIMAIGCDVEVYDKIIAYPKAFRETTYAEIDLFTISFMINLLEKTSPDDLELFFEDYSELVKATRRMAKIWNELVDPIKEAIQKELMPNQPKMSVIPIGKGIRKVGKR